MLCSMGFAEKFYLMTMKKLNNQSRLKVEVVIRWGVLVQVAALLVMGKILQAAMVVAVMMANLLAVAVVVVMMVHLRMVAVTTVLLLMGAKMLHSLMGVRMAPVLAMKVVGVEVFVILRK